MGHNGPQRHRKWGKITVNTCFIRTGTCFGVYMTIIRRSNRYILMYYVPQVIQRNLCNLLHKLRSFCLVVIILRPQYAAAVIKQVLLLTVV